MAARTKVAVIHTHPERVEADYRRVLALSGCAAVLAEAPEVVVYGNLTWSRYFPGASSPPWQLAGLASLAPARGWRWVAGRGHTDHPARGAQDSCWPAALRRYGQDLEPLPEASVLWPYPRGLRLMVLDHIYPQGLPIPAGIQGTAAVHLPTLKTHGGIGLAGAVENAWSAWLPHGGGTAAMYVHEVLVDLLRLQRHLHRSLCAVMDGTIAGDGAGPRTVEPRQTNVLLASTDPVALDTVAAHLAGLEPLSYRYLALAYALGLGCADLDQIEIVGDDLPPGALRLRPRRAPATLTRNVMGDLRLNRTEDWLFRLSWLPSASRLYYDLLWFYTVGLRRQAAFWASPWGELFRRYAAEQA